MQFTPPRRAQAQPQAQAQPLTDTPDSQSTAGVDSTQHGSVSATPTGQQQPRKHGNAGVAGSVFGTAHMVANVVAVGVKTLQSSSFRRHRTRRRRPVEEDALPSNVLFRWLFRACLAFQAFVWLRVRSYLLCCTLAVVRMPYAVSHASASGSILSQHESCTYVAVLLCNGDASAAAHGDAGSHVSGSTCARCSLCPPSAFHTVSRCRNFRRWRHVDAPQTGSWATAAQAG